VFKGFDGSESFELCVDESVWNNGVVVSLTMMELRGFSKRSHGRV
jgi:hypothetical protein